MKIYTCTEFPGHWPVGVAAVVVAPSEAVARDLLLAIVQGSGLHCQPADIGAMVEIDATVAAAHVLHDGDY